MKALIIAAGNGTRMQPVTRGRNKSLMQLLSLRIIDRVILASKEAGINEFVIVTGYRGLEYQRAVGDGSKYGVSIEYVQNDDWKKPNGLSVLRAKNYLKENFVLLMSDHVFDWSTLKNIQRLKIKKDECILAIDKNLNSVLDISDTTKTIVKNGRVVDIGKHLEEYNSYDSGMFYCTPYLFKALEIAARKKKYSLTNGMNVLVKKSKLRAFDIKGKFWSDCDTYADVKFAEKKLLKTLSKQADGAVARNFNRRVSTLITRFLIKTPITPNAISFFIPVLAVFTFFVLAKGVYPWLLLGGILTQFMSIIDGCDGEVARLKFMKSKWGGYLDANLDKYVDTAVIAGMSLGYLRVTGNEFIVPVALFVIFALGLDGYMPNKFEVYVGKRLNFYAPQFINFKRDIRLLILAFGAIFNQILLAFLIILFVYHLKVVIRLISSKRICDEVLVKAATAAQS